MRLKISHTAAPRMTRSKYLDSGDQNGDVLGSDENETIAAAKWDSRDKDDGERLETTKSRHELILT